MHKSVPLLIGLGFVSLSLAQTSVAQQLLPLGGVISGELNAVSIHVNGKRITTYQIASTARKLPGPSGLCNLETGPETFQLAIRDNNDVKALKKYLGKTISVKAGALACPQEPTEIAEAVVKNWTLAP
jgi:hypothetical protein